MKIGVENALAFHTKNKSSHLFSTLLKCKMFQVYYGNSIYVYIVKGLPSSFLLPLITI